MSARRDSSQRASAFLTDEHARRRRRIVDRRHDRVRDGRRIRTFRDS